jgi:peptidoglycan/LPS O-acetylase OafA/YrhL
MRGGPLCSPAMTFLGRISFAVYMLHVPVWQMVPRLDRYLLGNRLADMPWAQIAIATMATLMLSAAVYRLVEEPGRRYLTRALRPRGLAAREARMQPS